MKAKIYTIVALILLTVSVGALCFYLLPSSKYIDDDFIYVNGYPAVADSSQQILYCPRMEAKVPKDTIMPDSSKWKIIYTTLPVVKMTADLPTSESAIRDRVKAKMSIIDPYARTSRMNTVTFNCIVHHRGATSLSFEKKSLSIKLKESDYLTDLDADIFGIRKENNWILNAMAADDTRMRNKVCFDIWNEYSKTPYTTKFNQRNGSSAEFVELILNGKYWGVYTFSDKIDRKLLGLSKTRAAIIGTPTPRGVLYKSDSWTEENAFNGYSGAPGNEIKWSGWELRTPDDYPSTEAWQPLLEHIKMCCEADDKEFREQFEDNFYVDNIIDFVIFKLAFNLNDNCPKNVHWSITDISSEDRMLLTPWDLDASFGADYFGNHSESLVSFSSFKLSTPIRRMFETNVANCRYKLVKRWGELKNSIFKPSNVQRMMFEYADEINRSGAWQRERKMWNNNPVNLPADIYENIDREMEWYRKNYEFVDKSLKSGLFFTVF